MKRRFVRWSSGFCFAGLMGCSHGAPQDALPDPHHVSLVKVADFPGYTEGIAFDRGGTAYVSAGRNPQSPHAVYRLRPGAVATKWLDLRIPNGHKVLLDGTHVIAGERTIIHVAPDGRMLDSLSADGRGIAFERPNDIALDGHGGIYFTDPGIGDARDRHGRVFYVDAGWAVHLVVDELCYPNGLVVRADGRILYLDDSCDGRVYQFRILSPGSLGDRQVIATITDSIEAGLDGMTLDKAGRIYIAHNGVGRVEVLDPTGHLLRQYDAGNLLASNVAFGGPDLGDLYVTGSPGEKSGPGALYRLRLGVRGRGSMAIPAP